MMDIEQLAIEHGASTWSNNEVKFIGKHISFTSSQLEAFAKALQQKSEPVAEVRCRNGEVFGYIPSRVLRDMLPLGTELYTQPPNTVSLEQYNKLLDAIKEIYYRNLLVYGYTYEDKDRVNALFEKAIAEAERSDK